MKTAMQELIEHLDGEMKSRGMLPNWDMYLEKEKEQIVNAFEQGIEFAFPTNGSYYYNQTYNQNK